jgi:hypothetical protein
MINSMPTDNYLITLKGHAFGCKTTWNLQVEATPKIALVHVSQRHGTFAHDKLLTGARGGTDPQ